MTGRPPFNPTPALRKDVRLMKADGWADDRIALRLGISRTTLLKHFGTELALGADIERLETLRDLKRAARKGNASAIKMLLLITGNGTAVDAIGGDVTEKVRVRPKGKKQVVLEEALSAGQDGDWGDDLKPLPN